MFSQLKKSAVVRFLVQFFDSDYFIWVTGIVTFLSSQFGLEIPAFVYFSFCTVFVCLFSKNAKPIITLMLFIVFCISLKHSPADYNKNAELRAYLSSGWRIISIIAMSTVVAVTLIAHLVLTKRIKNVFACRKRLTFGLIAFSVGLILNGIFSDGYTFSNFAIGLAEGAIFLVVYTFFSHTLRGKRISYDYFCKIAATLIALLFVQTAIKFIPAAITNYQGIFVKGKIIFGWGVSNNLGAIFTMLLAPMLYMAYKSKYSYIYLSLFFIAIIGVVMTLSRGALFVVTTVYPGALVFVLIKGRKVKTNLIVTAVFLTAYAVCAVTLRDKLKETFELYYLAKLNDPERSKLYITGLENFFSKPIFGLGFSHQIFSNSTANNFMLNMYHNTLVQLLASCGIVGLAGYLWHRIETFYLFVKRLNVKRFFIGCSVLSLILTSLFDNHIFYFYPMFFYMLQLVFAERDLNAVLIGKPCYSTAKGKKPRILIPLVEAGFGHIMSALAIKDALLDKYSDEFEIVCVPFFSESNSEILSQFENRLVKFVVKQNKIPGFGKASLFLTAFFGKKVSLKYVMESYVPESYNAAMRYIKSFNADMIVSTHWATSYYAWRLKKDRPLVVSYCPDATFNVMFDTGADLMLISTQSGAERAREDENAYNTRIERVSCCLRRDVYGVSSDKKYNRAKNGFEDNRFTVVLADGGYGAGKIKSVVDGLLDLNLPVTIVAVAGKNKKLLKYFNTLKTDITAFYPIGFADNLPELIACADLFVGKSGAMTMAEPCFFGVPSIISYCATPIESDIADYYTNEIGCAIYIKSVEGVIKKILYFYNHPEKLEKYRQNAIDAKSNFGASEVADLLHDFYKGNS